MPNHKVITCQLYRTPSKLALVRTLVLLESPYSQVRITIVSDNAQTNCVALAEAWDHGSISWKQVHVLLPYEMTTPQGLAALKDVSDLDIVRYFENDINALIKKCK